MSIYTLCMVAHLLNHTAQLTLYIFTMSFLTTTTQSLYLEYQTSPQTDTIQMYTKYL